MYNEAYDLYRVSSQNYEARGYAAVKDERERLYKAEKDARSRQVQLEGEMWGDINNPKSQLNRDVNRTMKHLQVKGAKERERIVDEGGAAVVRSAKARERERVLNDLSQNEFEAHQKFAKLLGSGQESLLQQSYDKRQEATRKYLQEVRDNKEVHREAARENKQAFRSMRQEADHDMNLSIDESTEGAPSTWLKDRIDRGIIGFKRAVGNQPMMELETVEIYENRGTATRASYHDLTKQISLKSHNDPGTVVHELGHALEYADPIIRKQTFDFLERRTKGDRDQKLSDVTGNSNYADDEITKKDRFVNAYVGKQYTTGHGVSKSRRSTEILSMGLEMFFENPIRLAQMDADMFDFIFAVVRAGGIG